MTAAILALPLASRAGLVDRLVRSMAAALDADEADAILRRALDRQRDSLRRQQVAPAAIKKQLGALERAVRKRLWSEVILRPDPPAPTEKRSAAALLLFPSVQRDRRITEIATAMANSGRNARSVLLAEIQTDYDHLVLIGIDPVVAEDDLVLMAGSINARYTAMILSRRGNRGGAA